MENKNKQPLLAVCLASVFTLLFVLLIVLLRTVDVAAIGPAGTSVGFSHLNGSFRDWIGYHDEFYQVAQWLGYLAFAVVAGFAFMGLWQWIRRKSLWKVDRLLLAVGVLYLIVGALYLFFELVVINCRPILTDGKPFPEASFPSTHTMLACTVFGSAFWFVARYLHGVWKVLAAIACAGLLVSIVAGRTFSGAHWLTDILGGLLLSAALLCWFWFANCKLKIKEN
ncbi:MAG: phosphatase PAP2 family protein [Ruminococcaceae bacterium]|nr:phosphatase PAP2 family protein [Oscillospiraceae bacterium]